MSTTASGPRVAPVLWIGLCLCALHTAVAAATDARCGYEGVLCATVAVGSENEFVVDVVNRQTTTEHELRLAPSRAPRFLRGLRIEPSLVATLDPGQHQEFTVRFEVGATGDGEAMEELTLALRSAEASEPRDEVAVLLTIVDHSAGGGADFSGDWACPQRGVINLLIDGRNVLGSVSGRPGEHWGAGHRAGGSIKGTIDGRLLTLVMDSGDGTLSQLSATLAPDGKSFSGSWEWSRGAARLGSGTWSCARPAT